MCIGNPFASRNLYFSKSAVKELAKVNHPYLIVTDSSKGININQFSNKGIFEKKFEVANQDLIYRC